MRATANPEFFQLLACGQGPCRRKAGQKSAIWLKGAPNTLTAGESIEVDGKHFDGVKKVW